MPNTNIYKKEKKYTLNRIHKRKYKKYQVPKENKKYNKIKERKTFTRPKLIQNHRSYRQFKKRQRSEIIKDGKKHNPPKSSLPRITTLYDPNGFI
jgi:hypothetical protein